MKSYHRFVKRYLVILMIMIYFFVNLTYIFFLPPHGFPATKTNPCYYASSGFTGPLTFGIIGVLTSGVQLHCLYKAVVENKFNIGYLITAILPLLFISFNLLSLLRGRGNSVYHCASHYQHSYLKFCSFRI